MSVEAISNVMFIHTILSIILKGISLFLTTGIVFLPEIYAGH